MKEAHIAGIGTATPYPISTEQFLEVDARMRRHIGQSESIISQIKSFSKGTGIHTRHYVHPHWLPQDKSPNDFPNASGGLEQDIFTPNNYLPPFHQRMGVFHDTAPQLAIAAVRKALDNWGGDPKDITHIVTTCTSGWSEPGIAVAIMQEFSLSLDCQKQELNFNGCFCGASCLRIGRDFVRAGDAKAVLVVAVEVSSTHYDISATDPSSLVAHSLFADGAGAVILAPEGKWKYKKTGMSLVPDSAGLLGLDPPLEASHLSYRMHLDRHVGAQLKKYFRDGLGKDLLQKILSHSPNTKPALGIHPGGPNILDNVGIALQEHGWLDGSMQSSYDTLHSVGNLGAAAMLFVLARRLDSIEEDTLMTMAFGPGVTVEWGLLEKT